MNTHRKNSGILKNRDEKPLVSPTLQEQHTHQQDQGDEGNLVEFRKKVYENTLLNSKLTSEANKKNIKHTHHTDGSDTTPHVPKDSLEMKLEEEEKERLKWNQQNLAENEITKQAFQDIHIDEPKTPYQGAVDPQGEYYIVDDDDLDKENGGMGGFSLGEPVLSAQESSGINGTQNEVHLQLEPQQEQIEGAVDDEEEEDVELTAEEKHRRFEELRKKHYNIKDALKKNQSAINDEDDE